MKIPVKMFKHFCWNYGFSKFYVLNPINQGMIFICNESFLRYYWISRIEIEGKCMLSLSTGKCSCQNKQSKVTIVYISAMTFRVCEPCLAQCLTTLSSYFLLTFFNNFTSLQEKYVKSEHLNSIFLYRIKFSSLRYKGSSPLTSEVDVCISLLAWGRLSRWRYHNHNKSLLSLIVMFLTSTFSLSLKILAIIPKINQLTKFRVDMTLL